MLLKASTALARPDCCLGFSTLYRVDAIEGMVMAAPCPRPAAVSVPSIGSMLLKANRREVIEGIQYQFQYPLSGRCY